MKNEHPLEHKRVSCWERYSSSAEQKAMRKLADEYLAFLSNCKTEWETVAWLADRLARVNGRSSRALTIQREYFVPSLLATNTGLTMSVCAA